MFQCYKLMLLVTACSNNEIQFKRLDFGAHSFFHVSNLAQSIYCGSPLQTAWTKSDPNKTFWSSD